jgi:hypothetical protein
MELKRRMTHQMIFALPRSFPKKVSEKTNEQQLTSSGAAQSM